MKAPCRFCGDRKIGCHARCEKYLEFRQERDKLAEKTRQEKLKYDMSMKCKAWLINEIKRKQRGR